MIYWSAYTSRKATNARVSYALYIAGKTPESLLYLIHLYLRFDPALVYSMAIALLAEGSTEMVCMLNLANATNANLFTILYSSE